MGLRANYSAQTLEAVRSKAALPETGALFANKRALYWLCQFGGWGGFMAFLMLVALSSPDTALTPARATDIALTVLAMAVVSHGYRAYIVRAGWLRVRFLELLPRLLMASVVLAALVQPLFFAVNYAVEGESLNDFLTKKLLDGAFSAGFLYFCWSLVYTLYHFVGNYYRNQKYEAMINEFELNRLRSQLNPHFIFNALNTVRALVDVDPKQAKESINQLSNILRNSLSMDKQKVIPFNEEMQIVKDYLMLETTRFEDRLRLAFDLHPASNRFKVPPMMLQTVVENGIKHGIAKRIGGGVIGVRTLVESGEEGKERLRVQVRNTGQYRPKPEGQRKREGYGLHSTRQRLELLYQGRAEFSIRDEGAETVLAELVLPHYEEALQEKEG